MKVSSRTVGWKVLQVLVIDGWQYDQPLFCPACGSRDTGRRPWFASEMAMAECRRCGCHFGTAGRWTPDQEEAR